MNISKLLKITALCCIGVFSTTNNIVNASEDEMSIEDDIDIENNNDVNDLALVLDNININDNTQSIIKESLETLYEQNNLRHIISVNNCGVGAFPRDRIILITNGHNFFMYQNGIVIVCYNPNYLDNYSEDMINNEDLRTQIMNLFAGINASCDDERINSILNNNAHDKINRIVNELFDSYCYDNKIHDNYSVICQ